MAACLVPCTGHVQRDNVQCCTSRAAELRPGFVTRPGLICLRSCWDGCFLTEEQAGIRAGSAKFAGPSGRGGHRAWSEGRRMRGSVPRSHAQMEAVSSRQLGDLQTPEVSLAHRWPRDFRSEYSSDFEKDDAELQTLLDSFSSVDIPPERELQQTSRPEPEPIPSTSLPVYVMLPLDTVWLLERDGKSIPVIKREKALEVGLQTLRQAGVEGVMVDVWWGIVENAGPGKYDFSAYKRLFHKVAESGLKVQAVMSFHAAGGNVGDTCKISLPKWVQAVGQENPDIYYTDRSGTRNRECLSLGCDNEPLFHGRTPVELYKGFIEAFADNFDYLFGDVITEITVGLGPAGELRYPSYPEGDGRWRFPGVGEFQCFDRYMMASLRRAAEAAGHPEWGYDGPHDCGNYNSAAWETGFFASQGGSWDTEYGHFFLGWYSRLLLEHADRVLKAAAVSLNKRGRPRKARAVRENTDGHMVYEFDAACHLGVKLAGVHWWFKSRAHAAELTAGYYNTRERDGYADLMAVLKRNNTRLSFTCVEMRDCEHPPEGRCSPQGLLQQVIEAATAAGVPLSGENALQRYDHYAFDRIAESAFGLNARAGRLEQLTFLRMGDLMFDNWDAFSSFLHRLRSPPATPNWTGY
ncbi:beta-amylase 1, chloroplastic [Coccomyxa sp. Obi]|nr:beta-amylase-2 [Coccomyxa sp. Obi]BDA47842.1 beta-amylase 1, chloroplastic [Coccomyxa sp. Obi]